MESQEDEFSDYVARHWARLVRTAQMLGADPAEAEDVTQAALEKCLVHWTKVRRAEHPHAYVHRVLVNTFTASRRRRWSGERPTGRVPDQPVADPTEAVDTQQTLGPALARLTPDQRTVLVLRHWSGLSEAEIADVLGVAPGTVKSRHARAVRALAADPSLIEMRGA